MKKYFFCLLIIGLSTQSCKKFLETVPEDFVAPQNYYNNETEINLALNGVYNRLVDNYGRMYSRGLFSFFVMSDEFFYTGTTSTTNNLKVMDFDANHIDISRLWEAIYEGINRANLVLENIDKPDMDDSKRSVIKGEALFLRGYFYFLLVDLYGPVPLRLSSTKSPNNVKVVRSPVAKVYEQILKDMTEAEGLVNDATAYNYNERVTKTAVQAILARVYLTMAGKPLEDTDKYEKVLEYTDKVISSGLHFLNPDYAQIFINHSQDAYDLVNRECIWEIGMQGNKANGSEDVAGFVGVENGLKSDNETIGYSGGAVRTTQKLFDTFKDGDLRRDWAIAPYYWKTTNGVPDRVFYKATQIYDRSCGKWRREYETLLPKHRSYCSTNFPVIRFSDVLLMKAEAELMKATPDLDAARDAIEQVRRRAYGTMYGNILKDVTVVTKGKGYSSANPPEVTISGGGGNGAAATAIVASNGTISGFTITSRGTLTAAGPYYTTAPTVTIAPPASGATGTQIATANATITDGTEYLLSPTLDKQQLLEALKEERMRELCFEGMRKHDLIRWGEYVTTMQEHARWIRDTAPSNYKFAARPGENTTDRNVVFPIPNSEISINTLAKPQNTGW